MSYTRLKYHALERDVSYHKPEHVNLDDSALAVMTDLKRVIAATISARVSIDSANRKMIEKGIRLLLVVDSKEKILGIITATDILSEKPIQYMQRLGGKREDVTVEDIMIPQENLEILEFRDVSHSKIGDILETLNYQGRQHALVVDHEGPEGVRSVRGIFSVNEIARQLGIDIQTFEVFHTFAEIARLTK